MMSPRMHGVRVAVGVPVPAAVPVLVGVAVPVAVGVPVAVAVGVRVLVLVLVLLGVLVGVAAGGCQDRVAKHTAASGSCGERHGLIRAGWSLARSRGCWRLTYWERRAGALRV